jgi:excisionase family DNA binding protein
MAEQRLQNRYLQNGGDNMRDVKMGLTIEEAAEMSGIGRNTMRKLVDWGKLPVLKVGRKTIIRRDAQENFMTVNQGRNLLNQADVREVR